ncbi:SDR family NAD(P)-dependent oxidoreductase [Capillimicrobium parvum]|uniref:Ketoacyl reductase n=1 Tax=Capillimicrobium parvum TaxID=2884022 RepID=A0A9E6XSE8_9ACTN|nr:SDR family oxidoreductase [Capillimicrobium parvum]UGS33881.1 Putative ketoacyl reductase [Capillimicrobium parvum]
MSRVVVVTGGAKGIGRAAAGAFAALGDRVFALGRDETALAKLAPSLGLPGETVQTRVCDVADEAQVAEAFHAIGPVDVLVNNAGIAESAPLARTSLESWQRHFAVNATGAFLCTRAVVDGMRERDHGAIVTVASTVAKVGAPYTAAYTASKHAAVGLMRATAAEMAGTGVRANAVCPTYVDTEMTQRSVAHIAQRTGRPAEDGVAALAAAAPLGRLLDPHEVAAAVVWLASPEAASINGQALVLDGGGIQT